MPYDPLVARPTPLTSADELVLPAGSTLAVLMVLDDAARWAGSLDLRVDYRRPLDASPFLVAHAVCDGAWQGDVDNFVATGQGTFSLR